jgi:hypothetical protein
VADCKIAELVSPADLVITADIPLAGDVVAKRAEALNPRGELGTDANVGDRLAMRNLFDEMRAVRSIRSHSQENSPLRLIRLRNGSAAMTQEADAAAPLPLELLPYQILIVEFLKRHDPDVWTKEWKFELLKSTDRIDRDSQPELYCPASNGGKWLRVEVRPPRPVGASTKLWFRCHLTGA